MFEWSLAVQNGHLRRFLEAPSILNSRAQSFEGSTLPREHSQRARHHARQGVLTVVSLISPYRKDRDAARLAHEKQSIPFLEVFLDVPLSVVQARDSAVC
jgi:adenylylsulfate kinase-like enzyme